MSTPKFEDALEVSPLPDGRNWLVTEAFHYDTAITLAGIPSGRVEVPKGFITDFASIPRGLWNLFPPTGKWSKAAVIHDVLYRTPGLATRPQADAVLKEAMGVCQVGRYSLWTIYLAVRVGGGRSYKGGL